jgi:hypothetical protein
MPCIPGSPLVLWVQAERAGRQTCLLSIRMLLAARSTNPGLVVLPTDLGFDDSGPLSSGSNLWSPTSSSVAKSPSSRPTSAASHPATTEPYLSTQVQEYLKGVAACRRCRPLSR